MAGHGGIMNDADLDALRDATGSDAARLYLEGMVKHHQGAIEAREAEIADGQYGPAVELAKKMKTAQAAEITEMQALRTSPSPRGRVGDLTATARSKPPWVPLEP